MTLVKFIGKTTKRVEPFTHCSDDSMKLRLDIGGICVEIHNQKIGRQHHVFFAKRACTARGVKAFQYLPYDNLLSSHGKRSLPP